MGQPSYNVSGLVILVCIRSAPVGSGWVGSGMISFSWSGLHLSGSVPIESSLGGIVRVRSALDLVWLAWLWGG